MPRIWKTWREKRNQAQTAAVQTQVRFDDYRITFGGPAGQRVLADLIERHGVMQTSWNSDSAEATAFREGQRRVVLEIIELINRDPEAIAALVMTGQTEELFNVG